MPHLAALRWLASAALACAVVSLLAVSHAAQTPASPPRTAVPTRAARPAPPVRPPGAIVLFSGKPQELRNNWMKRYTRQPAAWKIQDGAMVASGGGLVTRQAGAMLLGGGDIVTRQEFQDFLLHLEFKEPYLPRAHGQERGNSGVGLHSRYEIQILDSYGIADPGSGDCGAVYSQTAPLFNACKPPLQWQTFDIAFRAPRFDAAGKVVENPRVTVFQNSILVQNNQEIKGMTGIQFRQYQEMAKTGPLLLQDHGMPVQFRNVWVRPLPPHGALHY